MRKHGDVSREIRVEEISLPATAVLVSQPYSMVVDMTDYTPQEEPKSLPVSGDGDVLLIHDGRSVRLFSSALAALVCKYGD